MFNNELKNPKKTFSNKVLQGMISGIARIISAFDIEFESFVELLKIKTIQNNYKKTSKIVETSIRTGVDRRVVSKIINNKYEQKKTIPFEIRILQRIREASKHYKDAIIPKYGDLNCLNTIIKRSGCEHVRMSTFTKILVERGAIRDLGDNIQYLGFEYKNKQSDEVFFGNISRSIDRYSKTILFNRVDLLKEGMGLFEKTIFSTQINPNIHDEVDKGLFALCRKHHQEIASYLEKYETSAPDTYEQIGVSTYQINLNKGSENE